MDAEPDKTHRPAILILGGTTEARALAQALSGLGDRLAATLSLAGRTTNPEPSPVPVRIGGFGGAGGLADWLAEHRIARVVDATHPFAQVISRNAAAACARRGIPLLALRRPEWARRPGDRWSEVADMTEAAEALGEDPRRVFLTIGRQELAAFAGRPQHAYHARMIEPPAGPLPPRLTVITDRGPFTKAAETAFLRAAGIEVVVSKNAGSAATYAKIEAARDLGLPVVMVRRPAVPEVPTVADAAQALAWLLAPDRAEAPGAERAG